MHDNDRGNRIFLSCIHVGIGAGLIEQAALKVSIDIATTAVITIFPPH